MSPDRTPAYVLDMLGAARELVQLVESSELDAFLADRVRCLAAEKLFINLGEAARRISPEKAARISGVPWSKLIAARNVLAHRYEEVQHEVLFRTARVELPPLITALEAWLAGRLPG